MDVRDKLKVLRRGIKTTETGLRKANKLDLSIDKNVLLKNILTNNLVWLRMTEIEFIKINFEEGYREALIDECFERKSELENQMQEVLSMVHRFPDNADNWRHSFDAFKKAFSNN